VRSMCDTKGVNLTEDCPAPAPDRADPEIDRLVIRMSVGDREAVAAFLGRYGPMIRRRVRGKMRASMRRLYDSQDILSTLGRRLDAYVRERKFTARTETEFWAMIFRVAQNSVVEKARIVDALRAKEGEDSPFAESMLARLRDAERAPGGDDGAEIAVDELLSQIPDGADRSIATLWCLGLSHAQIADHLDLTHDHVRKRWQRLRESLRARLEAHPDEAPLPRRS
jgi:DNA-directed RNA polymerase specialized sigma24 family protein